MKNLVLLGFMGAGKTTVGKRVAEKLDLQLVETDEEIETHCQLAISEIFSRFGEEFFRDVESQIVENCCHKSDSLVITGGGAVLREQNWRHLKQGVTISLLVSPQEVMKRVGEGQGRPLLAVDDPLTRVRELLEKRVALYRMADALVPTDGKSVDEVVKTVLAVYRLLRRGRGWAAR